MLYSQISQRFAAGLFFILLSTFANAQENLVDDNTQGIDNTVEVLHFWTSGGEAAALNILKNNLETNNIQWEDMIVSGGGGSQAIEVLKSRVAAENPPTAAQIQGYDIKNWAAIDDALGNLDDVAIKEDWNSVIPAAIQNFSKSQGNWIAVPVTVHSTNWLWINKNILDRINERPPQTWSAFVSVLEKMKQNGVPAPLSHGGQAWQVATIFDGVVLSLGTDFYKAALVDLNPEALRSDKMIEAFNRMSTLSQYTDGNTSGRFWNLASAMVIEGLGGVQIMGDWAKGEFIQSNKTPGEDFICIRFPGTQGSVTFNSDQFVMFNVGNNRQNAQLQMAAAVMDPAFQSSFNVVKGSAPARTDVSDAQFDQCGKKAIRDLAEASRNNTLIGSFSQGHTTPGEIRNAMVNVIDRHFNGEYSSQEATSALAAAALTR